MRHLYYALLAVAAIVLLSICFLDLGIDRKSNVVIALLCFIFFVYEPIIDYIFIKKMNLFQGKGLWKKYPFWGFRKKLLFK